MNPSSVPAALAVLAFLGTLTLVGLLIVLALWWMAHGADRQARLAGIGALGAGGIYLVLMVVASLASHEQVIPAGAEKYFCELDCHLAYRVTAVAQVPNPSGDGPLWAVTVQTRFDEQTISPRRPRDATLTPSPRRLWLSATDGSLRPALAPSELPLLGIADSSTPIDRALRPAESYVTTVWFRLPPDTRPDALLLEDDVMVSRFLIGNERSPLHAKTLLALPGPLAVR